jgi:hypothetical protein
VLIASDEYAAARRRNPGGGNLSWVERQRGQLARHVEGVGIFGTDYVARGARRLYEEQAGRNSDHQVGILRRQLVEAMRRDVAPDARRDAPKPGRRTRVELN